jgi:hypothetical protein
LLEVVAIGRKNAGKDPDRYELSGESRLIRYVIINKYVIILT